MNDRRDSQPDPMWERIVDDHRPRRRELAAAETVLRATSAPELRPDTIDAIVARATAAPAATPVAAQPLARARRLQKLVAAALMATLCLTSLAWVGARVIWPEHVASSLTMRYAIAVRDAIAAPLEPHRASAVSIVDDHCIALCLLLRAWATSEDKDMAKFAADARSELSAQLAAGTSAVLRDDVDVYPLLATAQDASLDERARIAALTTAVRAAAPGLVAMRVARLDAQNARYRADMIARLERTLK
jgi:hypothetical protein